MTKLNAYLEYKRDTSRFIYWIVKTSNVIIASSSALPDDAPKVPNTTGEVTVSGLVSLCKLIAKHINRAPSAILELLDSVINARKALHEKMKLVSNGLEDPDIERSNASHRHFIDALTEVFDVLGGARWMEEKRSKSSLGPAGDTPGDENAADIEQVLFSNSFSALTVNAQERKDDEYEDDGDASDIELHQQAQAGQDPRRRQQKKPSGKGKKGKHGKNSKKKKQQSQPPAQDLVDLPVESYRIIQDKEGIVTDYLMAVYALTTEWAELRSYLQGLWMDVAYKGLNSAVAGAVSNIAIDMIKRSAAAMFVDFPGHESHETVISTITRGDQAKAQGMFRIAVHHVSPDLKHTQKLREKTVDVKEQFMIYAYQDLVDFVTDYQHTRSGKPTKRMTKELSSWDPNLDLRQASETERLKWRRVYTINWLYDLVNVFSSIVVERNTSLGENHKLELVDWSPTGPWDQHRRLFGLKEFAGYVTHLAMQKPGTNIRQKISPHHVFQLQCIVDSFTVSRGWSLSALDGHVLKPPPHAFRPSRDIDLFLDRENKRLGSGFLAAVDVLKQTFQKDGLLHGDPMRHETEFGILESLQEDLGNWLGENKWMSDPMFRSLPSRFSSTNSNGLHDYSPFLCGVGLAEGLVEAYRFSFLVLDDLPEPMILVHLHNMLVQKGYITQPVGLYGSFQELFPTAFFVDGKIPTSNFVEALKARTSQRKRRGQGTLEEAMKLNATNFFKTKSFLMACSEAGWNYDKVPDSDIPVASFLGSYRLFHTKHTIDPKTGKERMEDTDLVKRARAKGLKDEYMIAMKSDVPSPSGTAQSLPEHVLQGMVPEGYTMGDPGRSVSIGGSGYANMSQRTILSLLKRDIFQDICGSVPFSSLNYVFVMARFMLQFHQFETQLSKIRNPLYVQAYETDPRLRMSKRVGLAYLALDRQDDECLRVMAQEFQNPRSGFMNYIYWHDLDTYGLEEEKMLEEEGKQSEQCTVM